ncbi:MAG: RNA polymerase sigma factor [Phycisphaerae bacterium]|nr:RNA polymerase sigma factor [Phycisphaerae bacterium]
MFIDELQKGSQQAFKKLIEMYSHDVVKSCYSFVKNQEDAEDIAQEVFLDVYRSIKSFKKDSELKTWIIRIAINESLDFLRKQKRKKRIGDLKELFLHKNKPDIGPGKQLEDEERRKILYQQIAKLPENQKIAMILSQYDKQSNKSIAEIMKTSESAVESLLHRARENLKKRLQKIFEKNI